MFALIIQINQEEIHTNTLCGSDHNKGERRRASERESKQNEGQQSSGTDRYNAPYPSTILYRNEARFSEGARGGGRVSKTDESEPGSLLARAELSFVLTGTGDGAHATNKYVRILLIVTCTTKNDHACSTYRLISFCIYNE